METHSGTLSVEPTTHGEFYWVLKDRNNKVVAVDFETYKTRAGAWKSAHAARRAFERPKGLTS